MNKTGKAPRGRGVQWTDQEVAALLLGIKNHTPLAAIGKFVGRTETGVLRRLGEYHREEWNASGHPQCHPWKGEGKRRAAAERQAAALRVVPDPPTVTEPLPPWARGLIAVVNEKTVEIDAMYARIQEQDATIDNLHARLARLEHDLGVA
jgi:hypothetical protein